MIWTSTFWKDTAERAVKTFAQAAAAAVVTGPAAGLLDVDWGDVLGIGALAAALSLLSSVGSAFKPTADGAATPSLVSTVPPPPVPGSGPPA